MSNLKSKCCGSSPTYGDTTQSYRCLKCNRKCEVEEKEELPKINWSNMEFSPTQTDDWEKRYWDEVVPRMINVDHTPALNFIHQLLVKERQRVIKEIREMIQLNLTQVSDATTERYIGYKECLSDLLAKIK